MKLVDLPRGLKCYVLHSMGWICCLKQTSQKSSGEQNPCSHAAAKIPKISLKMRAEHMQDGTHSDTPKPYCLLYKSDHCQLRYRRNYFRNCHFCFNFCWESYTKEILYLLRKSHSCSLLVQCFLLRICAGRR